MSKSFYGSLQKTLATALSLALALALVPLGLAFGQTELSEGALLPEETVTFNEELSANLEQDVEQELDVEQANATSDGIGTTGESEVATDLAASVAETELAGGLAGSAGIAALQSALLTALDLAGITPLTIITGDGYRFDTDTGRLTVTSNDGTTNWRTDSSIDPDPATRYSRIQFVQFTPGLQMTAIGDEAFKNCANLTTVTGYNSISSIGNQAFMNCINLANVPASSQLASIGNEAFDHCTSGALNAINLASCSNLTSIGESVFSYCVNLAMVALPSGLTTIGNDAFSNCSSLLSITFPASLTSIGGGAFRSCASLTSAIDLSATQVTSIGEGAFFNCPIPSVSFPASLTGIDSYAFSECTSLISPIDLSVCAGLTTIGEGAFYDCSSLPSVSFPASLTTIGSYAFYSCSSLSTPIDLSVCAGLTTIGGFAFYGCTSLTSAIDLSACIGLTSIGDHAFYGCPIPSVTFPANLASIGGGAFQYCTSLSTLTFSNPALPTLASGSFEGIYTSGTLYYPSVWATEATVRAAFNAATGGGNQFNAWTLAPLATPVLTAGAVSRTSDTAATVKFSSNVAGEYYYDIVPAGDPQPVIDTSVAGTPCAANTEVSLALTGLSDGAKDIYIVVKDGYGMFVSDPAFAILIPAYVPAPPNNHYPVIASFGSYSGSGTLTATIDADRAKFERLVNDATGAAIDPANYTIGQGSTLITLSEAYLKTLSAGTYTFVAEFSDGRSGSITLTITGVGGSGQLPGTGDSLLLPLLVSVLAVAGIGTLVLVVARRRKPGVQAE